MQYFQEVSDVTSTTNATLPNSSHLVWSAAEPQESYAFPVG